MSCCCIKCQSPERTRSGSHHLLHHMRTSLPAIRVHCLSDTKVVSFRFRSVKGEAGRICRTGTNRCLVSDEHQVLHAHSCDLPGTQDPQKVSNIEHYLRPCTSLDLHHLDRRKMKRWKIYALSLHNETKNMLHFTRQVMCKGGNLRGTFMGG